MLTASAIKTYLDCPRKYQWQYVERIRPIKKSDALWFGTLYHSVLESLDLGIAWDNIVRYVLTNAKDEVQAHQVLRLAAGKPPDDGYEVIETEGVFECEIGGVAVTGKRDRLVKLPDGRVALQEYKTSSEDISPGSMYWRRLRMDIQISLYLISSGAETIIYDVVRKPSIRQKKTETVEEYSQRLADDIAARPEWYYRKQEIPRMAADTESAIADVKGVNALVSLNVFPRNTASCTRYGECPYFSSCSVNRLPTDGVPVGFERLQTAHPELSDDEPTPTN